MSEQVDTFLAITGSSDAKVAEHFMDMAGGDMDTAISLFFEHGPSIAQPAASNNSPPPLPVHTDDDAALAERLQTEAYQTQQHNEPRAPDEARHETLIGGDGGFGVFPGTFGGVGGSFNGLLSHQPRANNPQDIFGNARPGIFNQTFDSADNNNDDDEDYSRVMEVDSDGEEIESLRNDGLSETQRRLARIFRPPFDIIAKLDLTRAKLKARHEKKWLLVNLQDNSEFQCQVLNRDFWSNKNVKDLVKDNFVFLQYQKDSRSGEEYSQFYHFTEYPHISILDPITGERLKMWSGLPATNSWIQEVFDFLAQFSLEPGHINPIVSHKKKVDPSALTEEQQMEMAIKQSLGDNDEDDKDDVEILAGGAQDDPIEIEDDAEEAEPRQLSELDIFNNIQPIDHPEPEQNSATTTRVQIRLGDGSRRVRRFNIDDKVRVIYEVLKATADQVKNGEIFTLTSQRENLFGKLDETITKAGLKNASILLELVDKD